MDRRLVRAQPTPRDVSDVATVAQGKIGEVAVGRQLVLFKRGVISIDQSG